MASTVLRRISVVVASALALTVGLTTPVPRAAAADAERTATLVGTLQSELGCSADWQASCGATRLERRPNSTVHSRTFAVPAGAWEYKIAIDQAMSESYGDGSGNARVVLAGPSEIEVSYDDATHAIGLRPTRLAGPDDPQDKALAGDSLRGAQTRERFYFLMADRFANGTVANDAGGLTGGRLTTGLDPTDKGFYHGGDLRGVIDKLDYIKGMGTTAIWLTPSFKNRPVQGEGENASAGYHGYWVTDFTQIDPHLGTNADMKELIAKAHAKGLRVYFDIITNHTADVIRYAENEYTYIPTSSEPYRDASGKPFDASRLAGQEAFPELNAESFPYTPVYANDADARVRVPGWLNDPTMYHNRGDSTWQGESNTFGDFVGLDDLFTERPEVVDGMGDIYSTWVDFGIDGFRIDTVKHVNMEFWQEFVPRITERARANGNDGFFTFGEVFDADPRAMSPYTTRGRLPATLDFGFQNAAVNAVSGKPTTTLRDFYALDDWYTDTDSNAYQLPTFLGNHDMGRIGMMLRKAGHTGDALLRRTELANELMYLTRGNPVTYYGDEQGFTGAGGDKDARQDMFGTRVAQYASEPLVGGGTMGTGDHYDTAAPVYRAIAGLSRLRRAHPALADGAQIHRYSSNGAGIYAFSRIDKGTGVEYVVALNTATTARSATFQTYTPGTRFARIYGPSSSLAAGSGGRVTATVPALSASVWRARAPMKARKAAPAVYPKLPAPGAVVGGRTEIAASVPENTFAQVSFAYRPVGTEAWVPLGTDDNAPYRVFADLTQLPKDELIEVRSVVKDASGNVAATSSYAITGTPAASATPGPGDVGPVAQPDQVSVPGSHNSEMGCPGDWEPACQHAGLSLDARDKVWKGTFAIAAGDYAYKAAIDQTWAENYGAQGAPKGRTSATPAQAPCRSTTTTPATTRRATRRAPSSPPPARCSRSWAAPATGIRRAWPRG